MERIRQILEDRTRQYNQPSFIDKDPISVPHRFSKKEDIEIAGFLVATIAWGNRKSIVNNGLRLMESMDYSPADFVRDFSEKDLLRFNRFVHRTFHAVDLEYFLYALKNIYQEHGGMEKVFTEGLHTVDTPACNSQASEASVKSAIIHFRNVFFELPHPSRALKHVSNPASGSAAKRLNMFLRWMVRKDNQGVDFGLWDGFSPAMLYCPLDVHSGAVARSLGLLKRKQNDWKAVEELTAVLRSFDPADPVKYDFALFGIGVFEK